MIFRHLVLAALGGVAFAQTGEPRRVGVFLDFERQPPVELLRWIERETQDLFATTGVLLEWRMLPTTGDAESFREVVIAKFRGECGRGLGLADPAPFRDWFQSDRVAWGGAAAKGKEVLPWITLHCDNMRRAVDQIPRKGRMIAAGRMLGRVLAHEMLHVLGRTIQHGTAGLARPLMDWRELLDGEPRFAPADLSRLHPSRGLPMGLSFAVPPLPARPLIREAQPR